MPVHVNGFDGGDRTAIELPEAQQQLVSAVAKTGKPIILVLMSGSAIALGDAEHTSSAILEAWYPGEQGGNAIAETLWGQNNPSARLPLTFYASTSQLPPFDQYSMQGRTYRYFFGTPLYAFGFGLSYTSFGFSAGKLSSADLHAGDSLDVTARLKNTGSRDGREIVQCYLITHDIPGAPIHALVGFKSIPLKAGQSAPIHLRIDPRQLSVVDADGKRSIQPGKYSLYIGGGQPSAKEGILLDFQIEGSKPLAP
jgi:beta-glucosidase